MKLFLISSLRSLNPKPLDAQIMFINNHSGITLSPGSRHNMVHVWCWARPICIWFRRSGVRVRVVPIRERLQAERTKLTHLRREINVCTLDCLSTRTYVWVFSFSSFFFLRDGIVFYLLDYSSSTIIIPGSSTNSPFARPPRGWSGFVWKMRL